MQISCAALNPKLIHERRLSKTKQTKTYLTVNHPVSDPVQRKRKRAKNEKNKIDETIFGKLSAIVCRNCCHCCVVAFFLAVACFHHNSFNYMIYYIRYSPMRASFSHTCNTF